MNKYRVKIRYDEDAPNPIKDYDVIGEWNTRVGTLGHSFYSEYTDEWLDNMAHGLVSCNYPDSLLHKNRDAILHKHLVMLPVFIYNGSQAHISSGCDGYFAASADGFVICDLDKARHEFLPSRNNGPSLAAELAEMYHHQGWNQKVDGKTLRQRVVECIQAEIEMMKAWYVGEVYEWVVERSEDDGLWHFVESCGGYYDEADCKKDGEAAMEGIIEHDAKEVMKARELARLATEPMTPGLEVTA